MKTTRKEVPVKNKPGIYKQFYWCDAADAWKPTGKYRSVRRIRVGEVSRKEQQFFANISDAIKFRNEGKELSASDAAMVEDEEVETSELSFRELVEHWKTGHFPTIELSTQQTYEKMQPTLEFLMDYPVNKIDITILGKLAHFWVHDYPRSFRRKSFEKEWQMLRCILQFYREEMPEGAAYILPPFRKLKKRTVIVHNVDGEVKFLDAEETPAFLNELKRRHPKLYLVALLQYFFALRIGEACGLYKDCINLEKGVLTIRRCVHWEIRSWIPSVKEYTKTKRVRYLPIPEDMQAIFKAAIAESDPNNPLLLTRRDGTPMNRKSIATYFNMVLVQLGFTHVSGTHFLRRTAATLANEATGDIDAISRFLGHTSVRVTRQYTGETDRQKQKVTNALSGVLKMDGGADQMFGGETVPQKPAPEKAARKFRLISDV